MVSLKHILPISIKKYLKNVRARSVYGKKAPAFKKYDHSGDLRRFEKKITSQNGEDGIIDAIFQDIGTESKTFCEFGYGILENNSIQLVRKGWKGLYIDAQMNFSRSLIKMLKKREVAVANQFLTMDNVNAVIGKHLRGEIDFLSIDVDGNDFWLWKAIGVISPRVVCVEYNASFGPDRSLTIPYFPLFRRHTYHESGFYAGASLKALEKLGREKGYDLVYAEESGVNAFFIRRNCIATIIGNESQFLFRNNKDRLRRGFSANRQFNMIKDLPLVEV